MAPRPRCFSLGAGWRADATRAGDRPHMTHFFDPEYGRRKSFTEPVRYSSSSAALLAPLPLDHSRVRPRRCFSAS